MSDPSETISPVSPIPQFLHLSLPPLNDLAPPQISPAEEKIPYDPSAAVARQLSRKDSNVTFNDWDANATETMADRKAPHGRGSVLKETMEPPKPMAPVHHPVGKYAETDPDLGSGLPEAVVLSSLPEVVDVNGRRQTVVDSIRNAQPFSTHGETMSMAPGQFLTVTPLHLLGDQPDMIDCPFCLRRSETKIVREASNVTHLLAGLCCITTACGVFAPYMLDWATHIEQHCTNCNRRVTRRPHGRDEIEVFGTPPDQRLLSKYPAAEYLVNNEVPPPLPAKNEPLPSEIYSGK
jgi:hypothetical protein